MPTISQLVGSERKRLTKKTKSPALKACPEREEGYVQESTHQRQRSLIQL